MCFNTTSNRLGNTVNDKNARLAAVREGVGGLDFSDFEGSQIDLFGDAYEFLISANSITEGLPREIELRQKQYKYCRDLLLSFPQ